MLRLTSVLVEAAEPPNQPGSVPQPSVTESTDNSSNLLINDQIDLTKVKITPPPKKKKQPERFRLDTTSMIALNN